MHELDDEPDGVLYVAAYKVLRGAVPVIDGVDGPIIPQWEEAPELEIEYAISYTPAVEFIIVALLSGGDGMIKLFKFVK